MSNTISKGQVEDSSLFLVACNTVQPVTLFKEEITLVIMKNVMRQNYTAWHTNNLMRNIYQIILVRFGLFGFMAYQPL